MMISITCVVFEVPPLRKGLTLLRNLPSVSFVALLDLLHSGVFGRILRHNYPCLCVVPSCVSVDETCDCVELALVITLIGT